MPHEPEPVYKKYLVNRRSRQIAREFNTAFGPRRGKSARIGKFDGRVRTQCNRLLEALSQSSNKPIEVLKALEYLLSAGYTRAEIQAAIPDGTGLPTSRVDAELLRALHKAYGFRYETYRLAGFKPGALFAAGVAVGSDE